MEEWVEWAGWGSIGDAPMNAFSLLTLTVFLWILFQTNQIFWIAVAGLLILAYFLARAGEGTNSTIRRMGKKTKKVYEEEMKELEATNGKYPKNFFDSVGKGIVEKINEQQAPSHAKSYRDAQNSKWTIKKPVEKTADSAQKILDSLGKLFSK
ncbi:MAG: hypothetical protein V1776_03995 [Candidatus Diapherotrites archaeon]